MVQVSYALREDQNSIYLLQDAGRRYDKFCQITVFGRNIIRPEFFQQYMYFAPHSAKYHGSQDSVTDIHISIEDNGNTPLNNYVAVIDSEVEFKITPSVIRQLSRDYMPAWGVKAYLDYFTDKKSGILLFLRVYKVHQKLQPFYLEKGIRGSAQVIKLYGKNDKEVSLSVGIIEPVISDNKFAYLKEEVLHLLKVENALIAQYDDTETGLKSLQERVNADRLLHGTKKRWEEIHQGWLNGTDKDDAIDMAQLDYEEIYRKVLDICPSLEGVIDYVRGIQPARSGEYNYLMEAIHNDPENKQIAFERLFEIRLRFAVRQALYYHQQCNVDIEDAFQEACIAIITAIQKFNKKTVVKFPHFASRYTYQLMIRSISPYDHNVRIPFHYRERIDRLISLLAGSNTSSQKLDSYKELDYNELLQALSKCTYYDDENEPARIASILYPAESIEEMIEDPQKEESLTDGLDLVESVVNKITAENVQDALKTLEVREREILYYRFGLNGYPIKTLEATGEIFGLTRERVRQIELKAKKKVLRYYISNHLISKEQYKAVTKVDNRIYKKYQLKEKYNRRG